MSTKEDEGISIQNLRAIIKELQLELIQKEQRIKELEINEITLCQIFKIAKVGRWCFNLNSQTFTCSKDLGEIIGLDLEESPHALSYFNYIHPDDTSVFKLVIEKAIESRQQFTTEHRVIKSDGTLKWMVLKGNIALNDSGDVTELVGTGQDITEIKGIIEKNHELNKANEILDNLIYIAGYDLKSPINNLKSISRLIQISDDMESKLQFLNLTETIVDKLNQTIEALLDILEVKHKEESIVKHLYFKNILENILIENGEDLGLCKGKIFTDFEMCPDIYYIEAFLTSIIRNLIVNAVKYQAQGRPCRISISTDKKQDVVILRVTDNGIGFDSEKYRETVFKPFKRLTHNASGNVIGLYIVKNMIEKNGGWVEVESHENIGTTFTCYLKEYRSNLHY